MALGGDYPKSTAAASISLREQVLYLEAIRARLRVELDRVARRRDGADTSAIERELRVVRACLKSLAKLDS